MAVGVRGRETPIPILCYHAIEAGPPPLCISGAAFARHVRVLRNSGCVARTVSEVARAIATGTALPDRAVAITFDDGYSSVHRTALPLLQAAGFVATVYPVTGHLGGRSAWNSDERSRLPLVGVRQIAELVAAGWEIGGHTHSHPALAGLPRDAIERELRVADAVLEDATGRPVRTFAYPYGVTDAEARAVAGARYASCLTIGASRAGATSKLDRLERIDAWYVRRNWQLRSLHGLGGGAYLALRALGRTVGKVLR